jgi:hypothetical protein
MFASKQLELITFEMLLVELPGDNWPLENPQLIEWMQKDPLLALWVQIPSLLFP